MYFTGIIIAAMTFLTIGLWHPIVIKTEYYFGTRPWVIYLLVGISCCVAALFISNVYISSFLGVFGASALWGIGVAFSGEFVSESVIDSKVYIVDGDAVLRMLTESAERMLCGMKIMEGLFEQVYSNYIDLYSLDAHGRYERLMKRCPQIVQQLSLKDIASYLRLHPNTISKIRHNITFGKR